MIALTKLRGEQYDAVLMDVVMPSMTGVELLTHIKDEKIGGDPICIMLTNQSEDHEKQAALSAGAAGYIVKAEYVPSEVVTEVIKLISK